MLSATPAETTAFVRQKLPTEIIGIICEFSDFGTHTAIRSTCSSVRTYVPLKKVVGFKEYKELVKLYKLNNNPERNERRRVFQERIHLYLHHEAFTQDQLDYLNRNALEFELCRIARRVVDQPELNKGIDLLFEDFFVAAASAGDLELLIRLLQVPLINPAARCNRAVRYAARFGRLEVVQFLLQDPGIPTDCENQAIRLSSYKGYHLAMQALFKDRRVDPSDWNNYAVRKASQNGHFAVVQELLQDSRVDPSYWNNYAFRLASENGHLAVVQALLQDPRVDPSDMENEAFILASENGHAAVVQLLLQDKRVSCKISLTRLEQEDCKT